MSGKNRLLFQSVEVVGVTDPGPGVAGKASGHSLVGGNLSLLVIHKIICTLELKISLEQSRHTIHLLQPSKQFLLEKHRLSELKEPDFPIRKRGN